MDAFIPNYEHVDEENNWHVVSYLFYLSIVFLFVVFIYNNLFLYFDVSIPNHEYVDEENNSHVVSYLFYFYVFTVYLF